MAHGLQQRGRQHQRWQQHPVISIEATRTKAAQAVRNFMAISFSANKLGWRALRLLVATRVNVRSLQDFGGLAAKAWRSDRGSFGTRHGQIRDAFRQSMPDF